MDIEHCWHDVSTTLYDNIIVKFCCNCAREAYLGPGEMPYNIKCILVDSPFIVLGVCAVPASTSGDIGLRMKDGTVCTIERKNQPFVLHRCKQYNHNSLFVWDGEEFRNKHFAGIFQSGKEE